MLILNKEERLLEKQ